MVRSDENFPERAVLRIDMRFQCVTFPLRRRPAYVTSITYLA